VACVVLRDSPLMEELRKGSARECCSCIFTFRTRVLLRCRARPDRRPCSAPCEPRSGRMATAAKDLARLASMRPSAQRATLMMEHRGVRDPSSVAEGEPNEEDSCRARSGLVIR